jgi:hypothetical protein
VLLPRRHGELLGVCDALVLLSRLGVEEIWCRRGELLLLCNDNVCAANGSPVGGTRQEHRPDRQHRCSLFLERKPLRQENALSSRGMERATMGARVGPTTVVGCRSMGWTRVGDGSAGELDERRQWIGQGGGGLDRATVSRSARHTHNGGGLPERVSRRAGRTRSGGQPEHDWRAGWCEQW